MGWAGALALIHWLLGARVVLASNASLSRRCWCVVPLRPLPSSRSPCRHVVVAPMRSRCHCAFSRQSPLVRALCRPALLVGHVGRPWLHGLVGRVVGVVVAVPGGGRRAYAPRRCSRKPRGEWPLKGPRPECGMGSYQPRFLTVVSTMPILRFLSSPGPHGLFSSIGSTVTLGPNSLFYAGSRGLSDGAYLGPH